MTNSGAVWAAAMEAAPIPLVHYTCTTCEVGWSSSIGNRCWYCQRPSLLMESIVVWYMKHNSQPAWRVQADIHNTGAST